MACFFNRILIRYLYNFKNFTKNNFTKNMKISAKRVCPCCGWQGEEFEAWPYFSRPDSMCPRCGSLERHRLYYLFLKNALPKNKKIRVLHFAPETTIEKLFRSYDNIDYLSADLDPDLAMRQEDLTRLSFPDNSFDVIFCSHVLEHVCDDLQALKELCRVLKPGGFAILQVPIFDKFRNMKIYKTFGDCRIQDIKEREKLFGHREHVRLYGRDYTQRLRQAGFKVNVLKYIENFSPEEIIRYSLLPKLPKGDESEANGWIYRCEKEKA